MTKNIVYLTKWQNNDDFYLTFLVSLSVKKYDSKEVLLNNHGELSNYYISTSKLWTYYDIETKKEIKSIRTFLKRKLNG